MEIGFAIILAFAGVVAAVVVLTVLGSIRQRRRRAAQPARHLGERQPQRGRVFKDTPSHSSTPDSWG